MINVRESALLSENNDNDLLRTDDIHDDTNNDSSSDTLGLPATGGLLLGAGILFLALSHIAAFFLGYFLGQPGTVNVVHNPAKPPHKASAVTADLGRNGHFFNDASQAHALLSLLVEKGGSKRYVVRFTRGKENIELTCDFDTQTLTRLTTYTDGSGTTERWKGEILDRLRNAAGGHGFSKTDEGEVPSEVSSFKRPVAPVD